MDDADDIFFFQRANSLTKLSHKSGKLRLNFLFVGRGPKSIAKMDEGAMTVLSPPSTTATCAVEACATLCFAIGSRALEKAAYKK